MQVLHETKSRRVEYRISPTRRRLIARHVEATGGTAADFFAAASTRELLQPVRDRLHELQAEVLRATGREGCSLLVRTDRVYVELVVPSPDGRSDHFAPIDADGVFQLPPWSIAPGHSYRLASCPVPYVTRAAHPDRATADALTIGIRLLGDRAPYGGPPVSIFQTATVPAGAQSGAHIAIEHIADGAALVDPDNPDRPLEL